MEFNPNQKPPEQRPNTSYGANTNPYDPYAPVPPPDTYPTRPNPPYPPPPPATPPYPHQYTQPPPSYPEQYGPPPMNPPNPPYPGMAPTPMLSGTLGGPTSPQPRPTSPTKTIVLLLLAALVVLVGIGLALFIPYQQAQTRQANATATAQEQAANVARAATATDHEATATVEANASATASVVAANPNPYPPNSGTLILYDPLTNDQDNRWSGNVDQNGNGCIFKDGAFHLSAAKGYDQSCGINSYTNFAVEARMVILKGDCGALTFRGNDSASYVFAVCQNGAYFLDARTSSQTNLLNGLSSAINTGLQQSNVIAVVARGTMIDLYVNGKHLNGTTDSSSSSGSVGFGANAPRDDTEVTFNDMKLWTL